MRPSPFKRPVNRLEARTNVSVWSQRSICSCCEGRTKAGKLTSANSTQKANLHESIYKSLGGLESQKFRLARDSERRFLNLMYFLNQNASLQCLIIHIIYCLHMIFVTSSSTWCWGHTCQFMKGYEHQPNEVNPQRQQINPVSKKIVMLHSPQYLQSSPAPISPSVRSFCYSPAFLQPIVTRPG